MDPEAFRHNFNAVHEQSPDEDSGYRLTGDLLGSGGQAWVFDAINAEGKTGAVKVFRNPHSEAEIAAFSAEANRLKRLEHSEHVVDIDWHGSIRVPVGQGNGRTLLRYPYMIMERAAYGSVHDYIGNLATPQAVLWSLDMMQGISDAHATGLVHRDIKPANLLVMENGRVKVTDFGIAAKSHDSQDSITHTQLKAGTYAYMPLEQYDGKAVKASDIYAAAVTCYQMATGELPITSQGTDYVAWIVARLQNEPAIIDISKPDGSPDRLAAVVQEVALKGLARYPKDRYATMEEFRDTLFDAVQRSQTTFDPATAYIDLAGLRKLPPVTRKKEPQSKELPDDRQQIARRTILRSLAGTALAIGITGDAAHAKQLPHAPSRQIHKPTPRALTGDELVLSTTIDLIDECQQKKQVNDVYFLVRHLIPVDHVRASRYIRELPTSTISDVREASLLMDLAFYEPETAIRGLQKYESDGNYSLAGWVAAALAFYGKQKLRGQSQQQQAARNAASRVYDECDDEKLRQIIGVSGQKNYNQTTTAQGVDSVDNLLTELRQNNQQLLIEVFGRVIARDNSAAINHTVNYYLQQSLKPGLSGLESENRSGLARDLAVDMAPFAPSIASDILSKFATDKAIGYDSAADTLALALAPYYPLVVGDYVLKGNARSWSQPVGVALARQPDFYKIFAQRSDGPTLAWLEFVNKPTKQSAKYAVESLSGGYFSTTAYWMGAGALKALTKFQK